VRGQNKAPLTIDLRHRTGKVSLTLYGLIAAEIHYAYEGGLYAQSIRTPQFVSGWDQPAHLFLMPRASGQLSFQLDKCVYSLSTRNVSLRVDIKQADAANVAALGNESYWDPLQAIHHIQSNNLRQTSGCRGHNC
jgi:alpha-L-arabinofuranosidase